MKKLFIIFALVAAACNSKKTVAESSRLDSASVILSSKEVKIVHEFVDSTFIHPLPPVVDIIPANGCDNASGEEIYPEGRLSWEIYDGKFLFTWRPNPAQVDVSINRRTLTEKQADSTKTDVEKQSINKAEKEVSSGVAGWRSILLIATTTFVAGFVVCYRYFQPK